MRVRVSAWAFSPSYLDLNTMAAGVPYLQVAESTNLEGSKVIKKTYKN
jgi:hypothetical protein